MRKIPQLYTHSISSAADSREGKKERKKEKAREKESELGHDSERTNCLSLRVPREDDDQREQGHVELQDVLSFKLHEQVCTPATREQSYIVSVMDMRTNRKK